MLQCALRYTCSCGHEYLVAFAGDRDNEAWFEAVGHAADSLGLTFIRGAQASFVCAECGDVHVRDDADPDELPRLTRGHG